MKSMRMSGLFSRTLREAPAGADSRGAENLLRAGYIKQLASGIFDLLPLGFKAAKKIEAVVREEMEAIGAQEILMPVVNPSDIWKETGRYWSIDREMGRFSDRNDRPMVLAMTHEEAATDLARAEIDSYKRLPQLFFQFQTKWRDDPRPRAGLVRVREFTMKDSYSFDRDQEGLDRVYQKHYEAYFRIFRRCGLPVVAVGSDSGMMGGKIAHEYMYLSPIGEDTIISCPKCGYTANRQVARFGKRFWAEEPRERRKVSTPGAKTIEELCGCLGIEPRRAAKALFEVGSFIDPKTGKESDRLVVGMVRGDLEIEENKLKLASGANALRPAREEEIRACGIVPGYGSPIGASPDALVVVDDSVARSNNLVAGANEEGFHYDDTNFGRDYSGKVADIASAEAGFECPVCKGPLSSSKGVEVGNIFQLGTRYSEAMGCFYQDENGVRKPVVMGSYGIGIGRLLACVAEHCSDGAGMALPVTVAPFQVHFVNLSKDTEAAEAVYRKLSDAGIEVLFDDRSESAGVKFSDADLLGMPIRLTLGNRSIKEGKIEMRLRSDAGSSEKLDLDDPVPGVRAAIEKLLAALR